MRDSIKTKNRLQKILGIKNVSNFSLLNQSLRIKNVKKIFSYFLLITSKKNEVNFTEKLQKTFCSVSNYFDVPWIERAFASIFPKPFGKLRIISEDRKIFMVITQLGEKSNPKQLQSGASFRSGKLFRIQEYTGVSRALSPRGSLTRYWFCVISLLFCFEAPESSPPGLRIWMGAALLFVFTTWGS